MSPRMLHDLRYATRGLFRSPAFTAVAILTLGLGIGAGTAVLTVARALFANPLPFAEADRLVSIWERRGGSRNADIPVSGHEYEAWQARNHVFEGMALYRGERPNLTGAGDPEAIESLLVSSSYFPLLRLQPVLGRAFADGEDEAGGSRVAILSDRFWRRRFGADQGIIGRTITLDDQPFTVIGVLGPLPSTLSPDALVPLDVPAQIRAAGRHNLSVVARLKPSVTLDRARSDMATLAQQLARELPDQNTGHDVTVTALRDDLVGEFRPAAAVMIAAVALILVIGCANVANLLLARGANRQREIAIRTALGAGRVRVVRQLVAESLVLAAVGGAVGLLMSAWIMDLLPKIPAVTIPLLDTARLNWFGLAAAAAIALCAGLAAGIVPALRSSRVGPGWLRETGYISDDRSRQRLRTLLVASEVALTMILLVGAGLLIHSFMRLVQVNPGFDATRVLVVPLDLPGARYPDAPGRRELYDRLLANMEALPGVEAAGIVSHLPLGGADNWMPFAVTGRPPAAPGQELYAPFRVASSHYFTALRIPLVRGRLFNAGDARLSVPIIRWFPQQPYPPGYEKPQAPPVAILSEAAARQFFGGEDPIGKRIRVLFSSDLTIVGIVGDIKHNGLNLPSYPHMYLSHEQEPWNSVSLVVKAPGDPSALAPAVRAIVSQADPALPVRTTTMGDVLEASTGRPRLYAVMTGVFGCVALALAVVGIFGVVSYAAAQRRREIGVRMALGAQRREVLELVVWQGMRPVAAGMAAGIVVAAGLSRFISTLLFGVTPLDPLTFVVVALMLIVVSLIACWIPAYRSTRIDPLDALRAE
jgi:putative ABC transport system permease protein